ncbi:hypothetical protein J2I47_04530 [Fibrella sp. HMF5335]|uniref:Uncharacterized protein n=1 Tax=Fibrella rubiginis TaxID=2817060 RepID=A0A939GG39_9BACT|nr:hypothetical protein [Fibrella rubiginis]MBO0935808.1 hypothetical protein [Fibrella rubiginis]
MRTYPDYKRLSLPLRRHQLTHALCYASWAILSLVVGGVAMQFTNGQWHHFVHMHAAWGSINLLISGWCLYKANQLSPALSVRVTAKKEREFRRFLAVNLGLDLLYIITGLWLCMSATGAATHRALRLGFGEAICLQGMVLLSFDLVSTFASRGRYQMIVSKQRTLHRQTEAGQPVG